MASEIQAFPWPHHLLCEVMVSWQTGDGDAVNLSKVNLYIAGNLHSGGHTEDNFFLRWFIEKRFYPLVLSSVTPENHKIQKKNQRFRDSSFILLNVNLTPVKLRPLLEKKIHISKNSVQKPKHT
jgi:hypothetical protein